MLVNLHVKNLALIEEADINFDRGLNILSGETGAGKSILLGSVNMALGGKASAELIRNGAEYALAELTFLVEDEKKLNQLAQMDISDLDGGEVILSRKIMPARSVMKVNGMSCTASQVRQIAALLLDIHGQHDSQQLLKDKSHLDMVDRYQSSLITPIKEAYKTAYKDYRETKAKLTEESMDDASRQRELSLLEYEINEITAAKLVEGEEEELLAEFKKMSNMQRIMEEISAAQQLLCGGEDNAANYANAALKSVIAASAYDESLSEAADNLSLAADMLDEAARKIQSYGEQSAFDGEDFNRVTQRLDLIHSFQMKYGKTIEAILAYCGRQQQRLEELSDYDRRIAQLRQEENEKEKLVKELSQKLSAARKQSAAELCANVSKELKHLNFMNTEFEARFEEEELGANGSDSMYFVISTNVGEALKPLSKVASGGELSRIMLAVKTVIAGLDDTQTLIFDEIDAGISGRTAQMVAGNLSRLSAAHQIICVTHLPQIAAYADTHFLIEKNAVGDSTVTSIQKLKYEETVAELARLLGGSAITDAVLSNARELKELADSAKLA